MILYSPITNSIHLQNTIDQDVTYDPTDEHLVYYTWEYNETLDQFIDRDKIIYLSLIYNKNDFQHLIPNSLFNEFKEIKRELKVHYDIYNQVFCETISFSEYLNSSLHDRYLSVYFQIIQELITPITDDYQNKLMAQRICNRINKYNINLTEKNLGWNTKIFSNPFTKLGRLNTSNGSFSIFSLKKEQKSKIIPNNDLFLEFDYNAMDLRTLYGLSGMEQVKEDLHEVMMRKYFPSLTRDEYKHEIFKILYSGQELDNFPVSITALKKKFYDGKFIHTPFGKIIECDEFHFLSYLSQSCSASLFIEQVHAMISALKKIGLDNCFAFTVHDSIMFDVKYEQLESILNLKFVLEETRWGTYRMKQKIGKNYGNLIDYRIEK